MEKQEAAQLSVSEQEIQLEPPASQITKPRGNKKTILLVFLGILLLVGAVFGAYKFGQRQNQPKPWPTPNVGKVFCEEPRPEVCTLECVGQPPFICGSDGKSYCSTCQACSNRGVEWYILQEEPCSSK